MKTNTYVSELSLELQAKIYEKLQNEFLLEIEDLQNAMDSRVCDLEEMISFNDIKQLERVGK